MIGIQHYIVDTFGHYITYSTVFFFALNSIHLKIMHNFLLHIMIQISEENTFLVNAVYVTKKEAASGTLMFHR